MSVYVSSTYALIIHTPTPLIPVFYPKSRSPSRRHDWNPDGSVVNRRPIARETHVIPQYDAITHARERPSLIVHLRCSQDNLSAL